MLFIYVYGKGRNDFYAVFFSHLVSLQRGLTVNNFLADATKKFIFKIQRSMRVVPAISPSRVLKVFGGALHVTRFVKPISVWNNSIFFFFSVPQIVFHPVRFCIRHFLRLYEKNVFLPGAYDQVAICRLRPNTSIRSIKKRNVSPGLFTSSW